MVWGHTQLRPILLTAVAWNISWFVLQAAFVPYAMRPLYTLRPKDIEAVEGRGYRPSEIRVVPGGLFVTLMPEPAR